MEITVVTFMGNLVTGTFNGFFNKPELLIWCRTSRGDNYIGYWVCHIADKAKVQLIDYVNTVMAIQ